MLPSESIKTQSSVSSIPEAQSMNADSKDRVLEYIDSDDRSILKERSAIMDAIEFSNAYPTKDRMKLGISALEVGVNLIAETLDVSICGDDYRSDLNVLLMKFITLIESDHREAVEK